MASKDLSRTVSRKRRFERETQRDRETQTQRQREREIKRKIKIKRNIQIKIKEKGQREFGWQIGQSASFHMPYQGSIKAQLMLY